MDALWPWLMVAASGALHGLNPASGWLPAVLAPGKALRKLAPIAAGQAAAGTLIVGAVMLGVPIDRQLVPTLAAGVLLAGAIVHLSGRCTASGPRAADAGLALWSFAGATAHGAGLMLVPALLPYCGGSKIVVPDALRAALFALLLHTAAMLAVTALVASAAGTGLRAIARLIARLIAPPAARLLPLWPRSRRSPSRTPR